MTRPRPVLTAASLAGIVQAVVLVLSFLGYSAVAAHVSAQSATLVSLALAVLSMVAHVAPHVWSQSKVTPISDPILPTTAGVAHADMKGE